MQSLPMIWCVFTMHRSMRLCWWWWTRANWWKMKPFSWVDHPGGQRGGDWEVMDGAIVRLKDRLTEMQWYLKNNLWGLIGSVNMDRKIIVQIGGVKNEWGDWQHEKGEIAGRPNRKRSEKEKILLTELSPKLHQAVSATAAVLWGDYFSELYNICGPTTENGFFLRLES